MVFDTADVKPTPTLRTRTRPDELFNYLSGIDRIRPDMVAVAATATQAPFSYVYRDRVCLAPAFPLSFLDRRVLVLACSGLTADTDVHHVVLLAGTMSHADPWEISRYMLAVDTLHPGYWGFGNEDLLAARRTPSKVMSFVGVQLAGGHFKPLEMAE